MSMPGSWSFPRSWPHTDVRVGRLNVRSAGALLACSRLNEVTATPSRRDIAVTDPELRVRGLKRLRIADASVMPKLVSGNTNAPCVMIGERCAAFLLE